MTTKNPSALFNVLGNDIRFNIVRDLASGEKCVCNIFKKLDLAQNLVSHHLAILRENGLIIDRKDGKWVHYSLDKKMLKELNKVLDNIINTKENNLIC